MGDEMKFDTYLDALSSSLEGVNLQATRPEGKRKHGLRCRNGRVRPRNEEAGRKKIEPEVPVPRPVPVKNAVMMLNEMFPPPHAPLYKVTSHTGPPNNPCFTMQCTVMGKSFSGEGKSKKDAKLACSQSALLTLFGQTIKPEDISEVYQKPRPVSNIDDWMELEGKNPVSILNELYPGTQFTLISSSGPSHSPEFVVRATLANVSRDGMGKSKKDAKLHASKALLVHLHKVAFNPATGALLPGTANAHTASAKLESKEFSISEAHTWADKIGSLVSQKFNEEFLQTTFSKRKVLAGIVMTRDCVSTVVCVSTGTKCINGENISLAGASLNDCHAEIITRRSFVYWLYSELQEACKSCEESIFIKSEEGGFELKANITFDLFISTAPCGDSRIFSLHHEVDSEINLLPGPAGPCWDGTRGKLRSKVESGMGTVPLPQGDNHVQTWDGVTAGDRLMTMSCSDKILRWNILGCQGSILSHWIPPVYFSSITIGSRFHPGHMSRAFFDRYEGQDQLKQPFRLHAPMLLATTSPESRQVWKSSDSCVNWILNHGSEIINGSTGKTIKEQESRLCKISLVAKFKEVLAKTDHRPRSAIRMVKGVMGKMKYCDLKESAKDYQEAKQIMIQSLRKSGAGTWMKKPVEQDQFPI